MSFNNSKIYNLKDLIITLKNKDDNVSSSEILKEIEFGFKEIEHLCFWDRDNYSKISIDKNGFGELVLICWEKDQQSPIHKHNINEAWTYVLKGELTEEVYNSDNDTTIDNNFILTQRDFTSITKESNKVHRLINSYNGRSVSLHLYKK